MKALILPYKTDGLAEMLSPLKLKEYLATRKPVVTAPIAAAREWTNFLLTPGTPMEWQAVLRAVLNKGSAEPSAKIMERLAMESWSSKAETFLSLCRHVAHSEDIAVLCNTVTTP